MQKKEYIIQCGGVSLAMYLTKITKKKGHDTVYTYGSRDKRKALRFTQEEAEEIAEKRHAIILKVNEGGNNNG